MIELAVKVILAYLLGSVMGGLVLGRLTGMSDMAVEREYNKLCPFDQSVHILLLRAVLTVEKINSQDRIITIEA